MRKRETITTVLLLVLLSAFVAVKAQDKGNEASVDRNQRGGARINPATLGLEFEITLANYPGRGIEVPVTLSYSSKLWRMDFDGTRPVPGSQSSPCYKHYRPVFAEHSASGWTTSLSTPYIEYIGAENHYNDLGAPVSNLDTDCPTSGPGGPATLRSYIRRILVHLPGGRTHEMRADDTVRQFTGNGAGDPESPHRAANWNGVYFAADSSNLRYVQNSESGTYRLMLPDGSFYDFDPAAVHPADRKAMRYTDRNGNHTDFDAGNGVWTDTVGRILAPPVGTDEPGVPGIRDYSLPGRSGQIRLVWKRLKAATPEESALTDFAQELRYAGNTFVCQSGSGIPTYCSRTGTASLFDGGTDARIVSNELFNPVVLTEIRLLNGSSYRFSYDVFGRIERIEHPTGGVEQFVHQAIVPISMLEADDFVGGQSNFGVVRRSLLEMPGDSTPYVWQYAAGYTEPGGYQVSQRNPDGTEIRRSFFRGTDPGESRGRWGYDSGLAGMKYDEQILDANGRPVFRNRTEWTKSALSSVPGPAADWHPRVVSEERLTYSADGTAVSSTITYTYDDEAALGSRDASVLVKRSESYGFVPAGEPLPDVPVMVSENSFLVSDPSVPAVIRQAYRARNLVGLMTSTATSDGAGNILNRTEFRYDEPEMSPGGERGNVTSTLLWDSSRGNPENAGAYVVLRRRYDGWGNQVESRDARGVATITRFDPANNAFPTEVMTAAPDPSGQKGSTEPSVKRSVFDPVSGLLLSSTDENGLETRFEYEANTLRPVRTSRFLGNTQVGGAIEHVYRDVPGDFRVTTRTQLDESNWTERTDRIDGVGRVFLTENKDGNGNIFVETRFDADGRVERVSNPYRQGEEKRWTVNVYDAAGRLREVILPDGSVVRIDHGVLVGDLVGTTRTVTDQAGRKRTGVADALGRMVRVIEAPGTDNLVTDYQFDAAGNLRKTVQGGQVRFFAFDSLGRMTHLRQPEQNVNPSLAHTDPLTGNNQWSVRNEYDGNANLIRVTDARNVTAESTYDRHNRITRRQFSDGTPGIDWYYDGRGLESVPPFSQGKLTRVHSSVSEDRHVEFDALGRLTRTQQITDGRVYESSYAYNLAGMVTSETYPSGRTVTASLDADGRFESVWSSRSGQAAKQFAGRIKYNAAGLIREIRLGNGRWEQFSYNSRNQISSIGLGHSSGDRSLLNLEYGYGGASLNNGSLRYQKIDFRGLPAPIEQTYDYDGINRLISATERAGGAISWRQAFVFDRYGNRSAVDAETTSALGNLPRKTTNPDASAADNRLVPDQDGDGVTDYRYDAAGNLILDAENRRFVFNAENRVTEYFRGSNNGNSPDAVYRYDGNGRRVKKITSAESVTFVYNAAGKLIAEYSTLTPADSGTRYLTSDHLGSPRVVTDGSGQVVSRRDYLPFGAEVTGVYGLRGGRTTSQRYGAVDGLRNGFTGYEHDAESGLDFAQARYYSPGHGRYTSVDPLNASADTRNPQTFNRYSYVLNSPYKFVDPLGLLARSTGASGHQAGEQPASAAPPENAVTNPEDVIPMVVVGNTLILRYDNATIIVEIPENVREALQGIAERFEQLQTAYETNRNLAVTYGKDVAAALEKERRNALSSLEKLTEDIFGTNPGPAQQVTVTQKGQVIVPAEWTNTSASETTVGASKGAVSGESNSSTSQSATLKGSVVALANAANEQRQTIDRELAIGPGNLAANAALRNTQFRISGTNRTVALSPESWATVFEKAALAGIYAAGNRPKVK